MGGNATTNKAVVDPIGKSHMAFNEMISKRFQYMDMSLNPNIIGDSHTTMVTSMAKNCKKLFQQDNNQRKVWSERIPELSVLERLYRIGIEVNHFQQNELMKKE